MNSYIILSDCVRTWCNGSSLGCSARKGTSIPFIPNNNNEDKNRDNILN